MKNKATALILGAGASACYENGISKLPTQLEILKSLAFPKISTSSGNGAPTFISTFGMNYSNYLGHYLRKKFNLPQKEDEAATKLWEDVAEKGLTLEFIYEELEKDTKSRGLRACQDFKALLRSKIASATGDRTIDKVCKFHRKLVKSLEPGDYIIDFNWDTVIDDVLLYESPFWFPISGYGIPILALQGDFNNKHFPIDSHIELYHIHGSVALYEPINKDLQNKIKACVAIGPKGYSSINELVDLIGITKEEISNSKKTKTQTQPKRTPTEKEMLLIESGCIRIGKNKTWFQPIFVPPSKTKPEYKNWYSNFLRKKIHSRLPFTKQIIIIGYSFPRADFKHLSHFFVSEIIPEETEFICINPDNNKKHYRKKAKTLFPNRDIDFSITDFKQFCEEL